jgi:hypothetical protein
MVEARTAKIAGWNRMDFSPDFLPCSAKPLSQHTELNQIPMKIVVRDQGSQLIR